MGRRRSDLGKADGRGEHAQHTNVDQCLTKIWIHQREGQAFKEMQIRHKKRKLFKRLNSLLLVASFAYMDKNESDAYTL